MKNMKTILAIVITAVVCTTIGVIAGNINANQVTYTKDNTDISVSSALDNLYSNLETKMAINAFGNALISSSYGDRIANRTTSQQLNKGKYIVIDYKGFDYSAPGYPTSATHVNWIGYRTLKCSSNNCTLNLLADYMHSIKASLNNDHVVGYIDVYFLEVVDDSDTISAYINDGAIGSDAQYESIIVIPINEN